MPKGTIIKTPMIDSNAIPMPIPMDEPNYVVLEYTSKAVLAERVVAYMKDGWKPQGGIHVRKAHEWQDTYSQAMVKW